MKKAMFFTLTTILFLSIFFFYFTAQSYRSVSLRANAAEQRVNALNNYIKNMERDMKRGLQISSFRSLVALTEFIYENESFLKDPPVDPFSSALINGTVYNLSLQVLVDSTFPIWVDKIQQEAAKLHINTTIGIGEIYLYQKDPWEVTVGVNLSINVSDIADSAVWYRTRYLETDVSIISFEDPLFIIEGGGSFSRIINDTIFDFNYVNYDADNDNRHNTTNLVAHMEGGYYTASNFSPSYLMRLMGNLSNSTYGIESMLDLFELQDHQTIFNGKSIIDAEYWNTENIPSKRINNTPSWFKLDVSRLERYNSTLVWI